VITHLLEQIPYEPLRTSKVVLPKRKIHEDAGPPRVPLRHIPTPY